MIILAFFMIFWRKKEGRKGHPVANWRNFQHNILFRAVSLLLKISWNHYNFSKIPIEKRANGRFFNGGSQSCRRQICRHRCHDGIHHFGFRIRIQFGNVFVEQIQFRSSRKEGIHVFESKQWCHDATVTCFPWTSTFFLFSEKMTRILFTYFGKLWIFWIFRGKMWIIFGSLGF